MITKKSIAYLLLSLFILHTISPYIFEKRFYFNEILSFFGFAFFCYKFRNYKRDSLSILMLCLIGLCLIHAVISIFTFDFLYVYLRNTVIFYSMFSFFLGFWLLPYFVNYLKAIKTYLRLAFGFFLIIPKFFLDRYSGAALFPFLLNKPSHTSYFLIIFFNILYAVLYESSTSGAIAGFFILFYFIRTYLTLKIVFAAAFIAITALFIYLSPNLAMVSEKYDYFSDEGILEVMHSHPLLGLDPNNTWRLVLWHQIIVDLFPLNLFGAGFGTPVIKYFPIDDFAKLDILPYVLGAHNSFVYLFGRLGVMFIIILFLIYRVIFKEYFLYYKHYHNSNEIFFFFAFFSVSVIAFFNPFLETPIYASIYWAFLGFLGGVIYKRKQQFRYFA